MTRQSPNMGLFNKLAPRYIDAYKKCNNVDIEVWYLNGKVHIGKLDYFPTIVTLRKFEEMVGTMESRIPKPREKEEVEPTPLTDYLIKHYGFAKERGIFKRTFNPGGGTNINDIVDLDRFTCSCRVHVLHYLMFSETLKHFTIRLTHDHPKGSPGTSELTRYSTMMIPRVIDSTDVIDQLMKFFLIDKRI